MTSTDTANVAMVSQTVAGDTMSSMGESPAQSSDSALEMLPRRGSSGGKGQERSAEQSLPAPVLPTIQDQDDGPDDFGLSQSMLPQSLPEIQDGEGSLFMTPRRSRSGSVTSTMGRIESGTCMSGKAQQHTVRHNIRDPCRVNRPPWPAQGPSPRATFSVPRNWDNSTEGRVTKGSTFCLAPRGKLLTLS